MAKDGFKRYQGAIRQLEDINGCVAFYDESKREMLLQFDVIPYCISMTLEPITNYERKERFTEFGIKKIKYKSDTIVKK